MSTLCTASLDQARRNRHQISELNLVGICTESGIHVTQHNLQRSAPIYTHPHTNQALKERSPHSSARNEKGHHIPKNESSPISETNYRPTTPSSTSELHSPPTPLLHAIYWVSKIPTGNNDASKNDRHQLGEPMNVAGLEPASVFSPHPFIPIYIFLKP